MIITTKEAYLLASFPVPVLKPITSTTIIQNLQKLQTEFNTNAVSVYSTITDFGHLVLSMIKVDYLAKGADNLPSPTNPKSIISIRQRTTTTTFAQAQQLFSVARKIYDIYNTYNKTLKAQILAIINHLYISDLHDDNIGFAFFTALDIMTHL